MSDAVDKSSGASAPEDKELVREGMYQERVNRQRRYMFVARVVGFCLITSSLLVFGVGMELIVSNAVIETYISGLLGLATAVGLSYIGGSVIDYNGGFGNMFSAKPTYTNVGGVGSGYPPTIPSYGGGRPEPLG